VDGSEEAASSECSSEELELSSSLSYSTDFFALEDLARFWGGLTFPFVFAGFADSDFEDI
jgi:hypothetical protein